MFKKVFSVMLVLCVAVALCSCGADTSEGAKKYGYDHQDLDNMVAFVKTTGEKHSTNMEEKTTVLIENLGDTFDSYQKNKSKISEFYADALADSDELFAALKAVSSDYYQCVAKDHFSEYKVWTGAMSDMYDSWTKAMEHFYDTCGDCFQDVFEACSDFINLGYDEVPYKECSGVYSDMYDEYSDAWSDMYKKYSDTWGDLYQTYSDVWGSFYAGKTEIHDILHGKSADSDKASKNAASEGTNKGSEGNSHTGNTDAISLDTLADEINKATEKEVSALTSEYDALRASITTYSEYVSNVAKVEAFYDKANKTSKQITAKLYEYSVIYAEKILQSGMTTDDMYDAFDGLYDCIYESAADILYDGIYDGVLGKIYDDFYDGVLDVCDDSVSYSDWSKVCADEYKRWSETSSNCYEHWTNMRSDVYDFWSDMRNEMYRDDLDQAKEVLEDFKEDVQKLQSQKG